MKDRRADVEDVWLDKLDAIAAGDEQPSPGDDELLHIAGRLTAALAPLGELDAGARAHKQRLGSQLRLQLAASKKTRLVKRWAFRSIMVAVALLVFMVLGPGLLFQIAPGASQNDHTNGAQTQQGWQMLTLHSTSAYTIATPANLTRGIALLLPTEIAPDGYLVAISIDNYGNNVKIASYLVYEQDAIFYETPSRPFPPDAYAISVYQTVSIGKTRGFLYQEPGGTNRLEWYQAGLLCDLVSKLPAGQLIMMADELHSVTF